MLRILIQGKVFGSTGVIILLLMILTAFLRICFTLGSNELLGGNRDFTNLSTAIPLIGHGFSILYLGA